MNLITTLAPCGMNCELCHSFQNKKKNCPGCRGRTTHCVITRCEKKQGYCFECPKFPGFGRKIPDKLQHEHARQPRLHQGIRGRCFYTTTTGKIPLSRLWQFTDCALQLLYLLQTTETTDRETFRIKKSLPLFRVTQRGGDPIKMLPRANLLHDIKT